MNPPSLLRRLMFGRARSALLSAAVLLPAARRATAGENFSNPPLLGCDMSFTDENQYGDFPYNGVVGSDPFQTLAANGVNYVRLRVYVEWPYQSGETTPPTWCNEYETVKMAQQIKADGLKLEIDFMYSDHMVGAGDGVQPIPPAWAKNGNATLADLETDVYDFTSDVLTDLANNDAPADLVQIGNEINDGIIGQSPGTEGYYDLLDEGCQATRDVDSTIGIVLHYAGTTGAVSFFNDLTGNDPGGANNNTYVTIPFDAIGLSLYPQWFTLVDLADAFQSDQLGQFGKYLLVQETGFPWGTAAENGETPKITSQSDLTQTGYTIGPDGQYDYISDMIATVAANNGVGVFYWAADDVTGWDGRAAADFNCAFWDSVTGDLIQDGTGVTSLSAFNTSP